MLLQKPRYILLLMICLTIIFCILLSSGLSKKSAADDSNLLGKVLDRSITTKATNIVVKNGSTVLKDGTKLYYLEAKSPEKVKRRGNLLYLHGAAYSSHDWNRTNPSILQLTAAAGYYIIAIDLPGFTYSRTRISASHNHSAFISSVIEKLNISKPVIISPSASGSYSIPYVLTHANKIGAFVPVAPCCVRSSKWENFMAPTLIIYGSEDRAIISMQLLKIPKKYLVIIPDAPHAAYIKKPTEFVTALINFLSTIHL